MSPAPALTSTSARRTSRVLGWAVGLLLVAALSAFMTVGANRPADPRLEGEATLGFGTVAFNVAPPSDSGLPSSARFCALLAENDEQRAKGLMGRRDLAGYDAMIFRFDQDTTTPFFMRNVPVPLSIAWFDAGGRFVSSADMEPCADQDDCPLYMPSGPYRLAVEVLEGGLARLGIEEGSHITLDGTCTR